MSDTPQAPLPTRRGWLIALLRIALVAVAGFAAWYVAGNWSRWTSEARFVTTEDAAMAGDVTPLAAKVSGTVEAVPVDDYQTVAKGDLLVQIDASAYRAQLDLAQADLAGLGNPDDQKEAWRALIRQAEARVALARNAIADTRITAPADGMVGQRLVRPGQFVTVGTPVIAVVALPDLWVIANYKETQMTRVRVGQTARVTVDAFPDLRLTGHVASWAPATAGAFAPAAPDNAIFTKVVQRVPVKIVLDPNPAIGTLVRPGMSAEVTIDTASNAGTPGQKAFAGR